MNTESNAVRALADSGTPGPWAVDKSLGYVVRGHSTDPLSAPPGPKVDQAVADLLEALGVAR